MSDVTGDLRWPEPAERPAGSEVELAKLRYAAELELEKARRLAVLEESAAAAKAVAEAKAARDELLAARLDAQIAAERELRAAVHQAYLDVGKSVLDRSLARANFVTGAAAAIATTYTGLLALVFSVSGDAPRPMPAVGIVAALLLGLSVAFSAFYVGYLKRATLAGRALPSALMPDVHEARLRFFLRWTAEGVHHRAWALRLAVLCLGAGLISIPLPFLELAPRTEALLVGFAFALVVAAGLGEIVGHVRRRPAKPGGPPPDEREELLATPTR